MTPDLIPRTQEPFTHQELELLEHWEDPYRAIFWEQGTGKTRAVYEWFMMLWQNNKIDAMLIVSPTGVDINWIQMGFHGTEWENSIIPEIWHPYIDYMVVNSTAHGSRQRWNDALLMQTSPRPIVISMTHSALRTPWGLKYALDLCTKRNLAVVVDESSVMENTGTVITRNLLKISRRVKYKRILEGTPADEGAFNLYPQMRFLKQTFWNDLGIYNFSDFKNYFAIWEQKKAKRKGKVITYPSLQGWQNLDILREYMKNSVSRVLKKDVLDLPGKRRHKINFEMSPEQKMHYEEIQEELFTVLKQSNEDYDYEEIVSADTPLVQILRMYQITCGYLPLPNEHVNGDSPFAPEREYHAFKENPRYDAAIQFLEKQTEQTIIWALQHRDIDLLAGHFGDRAFVCDGRVPNEARIARRDRFQAGGRQFIICQIQSMARGHTMNRAHEVLYYTWDSRLRQRQQSEDRAHRGLMEHSVRFTDMMCLNSIDEIRLSRLAQKLKAAKEVMGDE